MCKCMKSRYNKGNVSRSFMMSELKKYFGDKVTEYGIMELDVSVGEYFELMRILRRCIENNQKNPLEFEDKIRDLSIFSEKDLSYLLEKFSDGFCSDGGFVTPGAYFIKECKPDCDTNLYGVLTLVAANDIYNNKLRIPRNKSKRKVEEYCSHSVLVIGKYVLDTFYSQNEVFYISDYLDILYTYNKTIKILNKGTYYMPIEDKHAINENQFKMFTLNYNGCTKEEFHSAASTDEIEGYFSDILFQYTLNKQSINGKNYEIVDVKRPHVRKITIF